MNPLKRLRFVAILLAGLYPGLSGVAAEAVVSPEDIAVLVAVGSACAPDSESVVVSDSPAALPQTDAAAERRFGLPADIPLRAELAARSREAARWPHVDLGACARVIAGAQAYGGNWRKVSLPGFSADRTHALVYVTFWCGAHCGTGEYIALTRGESGWLIAQRYLASVS